MSRIQQLSVEQMRGERDTFQATYIQFVGNVKDFKSRAFCFYEGEDGKYYDSRIRKIFNSNEIVIYPVGNKKEVLKLLKKIRETNLYKNVCTMFFVDRDYDKSRLGDDEDLFETPCYSIENLYVRQECLINILQSEFGLNSIEEDCKKCMHDFELREKEFNDLILEFNALVYLRRKKSDSNSNYSFASIKTSHLVKVEIDGVSKAAKYDETIANIKKTLQFQEAEIEEMKKELIYKGDFSVNFRGKNQLDFFVAFINELKRLNKKEKYFSYKLKRVHINITENRLSELSQYAYTPPSLKIFLENHRKKFLELCVIY